MAEGASTAPRRKSTPGLAMAIRMRSLWSSSAATTAAMTTGNTRSLPVASLRGPAKKRSTTVAIERELVYDGPARELQVGLVGREVVDCRD